MNKYKISFSMFPIQDNKITSKGHFSNCTSTIEGNTFEEAVAKFKEEQRNEGWAVGFLIQGDIAEVTFYDLEPLNQVKKRGDSK